MSPVSSSDDPRRPPTSSLEPRAGEPGYVASSRVVDELERALDALGGELGWVVEFDARRDRPGPAVERATRVLDDARMLVDVLRHRLTIGALVDVQRRDEERRGRPR